jgi:DNA-binding LacI/PurR family transcriptional regulator
MADGRSVGLAATRLRHAINSRRFEIGKFVPPVRQLSTDLGFAPETIRRALKALEAEKLVAAEPRQGFRVLAREKTADAPISYLMSGPPRDYAKWDEMHRTMLGAMQQLAAEKGRALLTLNIDGLSARQLRRQTRAERIRGAVMDTVNPEVLSLAREIGLPLVLVNDFAPDAGVDTVVQDGFTAGIDAVAHLLAEGHERIGWVGIPPEGAHRHYVERYGGVVAGLAAAGRSLRPELTAEFIIGDHTGNRDRVRKVLGGRNAPTAIVTQRYDVSALVGEIAIEAGMELGRDLALIGWSTEEWYESVYASKFPKGSVPPAMVWSITDMMKAALARIEQRHAEPDLPVETIKLPMKLKPGDEA